MHVVAHHGEVHEPKPVALLPSGERLLDHAEAALGPELVHVLLHAQGDVDGNVRAGVPSLEMRDAALTPPWTPCARAPPAPAALSIAGELMTGG